MPPNAGNFLTDYVI